MAINKDVADNARRGADFERPVGIALKASDPNDAVMEKVFKSLMGPENHEKNPLLTVPATEKRSIIDAVPTHNCEVCKQVVWMSPSSLKLDLKTIFILCWPCFNTAMEAEKKASSWHER